MKVRLNTDRNDGPCSSLWLHFRQKPNQQLINGAGLRKIWKIYRGMTPIILAGVALIFDLSLVWLRSIRFDPLAKILKKVPKS
ncbi:hypothetical protein N9230_05450 [Akkermansiaceae bacterium]|nr:hypothetical protein [Akkermansiaceae bacterium]